MKFTVTILDADGTITNFYDFVPPLSMLQDWVGGPIEVVPEFTQFGPYQCVAFCHEEGKLDNLPMNLKATLLWATCIAPFRLQDVLHGNVVVISAADPADLKEL